MSKLHSRVPHRLQEALRRLRNRIRRPNIQFTADMTIDEAWHAHPHAPTVFAQYKLPGCDGCAVRFEERIEEAAEAYGVNLERFLHDLNRL